MERKGKEQRCGDQITSKCCREEKDEEEDKKETKHGK